MKYILFFFLVYPFIAHARDNITGVWQQGDSLVTAGLKDVYRFYPDGTFQYDFTHYCYNGGVKSFGGKYFRKGDDVFIQIQYLIEPEDLEIIEGNPGADNEWLVDYKKTRKIKTPVSEHILNLENFYKISDNPWDLKN